MFIRVSRSFAGGLWFKSDHVPAQEHKERPSCNQTTQSILNNHQHDRPFGQPTRQNANHLRGHRFVVSFVSVNRSVSSSSCITFETGQETSVQLIVAVGTLLVLSLIDRSRFPIKSPVFCCQNRRVLIEQIERKWPITTTLNLIG